MSGILAAAMLPLASHGGSALPAWLQGPGWMHHASHGISAFLWYHRALGLFTVIFCEELGIPLPIPGDVAIAFGGYLTARGDLNYFEAYLCVVGGAVAGSSVLFQVTRRYGRAFIIRLSRYLGQDPSRLDRAEAAFHRWGHWAIIIGRLIPGLRIWLTALSGVLNVPYRVFLPSVLVSSIIWAAIFIELGRRLGRRTLALFRLVPAHLLPWLIALIVVVFVAHLAWERRSAALGKNRFQAGSARP